MVTHILIALCLLATVAQGQVVRKVLRPDLAGGANVIGWFPFEKTAVNLAASGSMTLVGSPLYGNDRSGSSLMLAATQYGSFTASTVPNPGTNNFTISCWFRTKKNSASYYDGIIELYENASTIAVISQAGSGFSADYSKSNFCHVVWRDNAGALSTRLYSPSRVNDGQWHFAAVVRTLTTLAFFFDGAWQSVAYNNGATSTANPWLLGRANSDSSRNFVGDVDEVRFYQRSLTRSELNTIYYSRRPTQ
jgi:hypothetical protein